MLFVVFTFGEMVVDIAGYFEGPVTLRNFYFAAMTFLIVVGLFLSYETLYDHIIDRDKRTNGLGYMFRHVFMIFGLNNISSALEFMLEEEVRIWPKMIFLVTSMVIYYAFLFSTRKYAKECCRQDKNFFIIMGTIGVTFVALMLLLRNVMVANIAVTVVYVYLIYILLHRFGKRAEQNSKEIQVEA